MLFSQFKIDGNFIAVRGEKNYVITPSEQSRHITMLVGFIGTFNFPMLIILPTKSNIDARIFEEF